MQHIELRLADIGERQALFRSIRDGDRAATARPVHPPVDRRVAHPARPAHRRRRRLRSRVAGMTRPRRTPGPGSSRTGGTLA